jgi:tetratricopeptide (TPR) repeat protein
MSPLWDEVEQQADQVVNSILEWMEFFKKRPSARSELSLMLDSGKGELERIASSYRVDAAQTHALLGIEFYHSGKVDEAEAQFKKANEILPQWVDPWASLGKLYYDSKRYIEAVQALVEALKITPRDADLWIGIGLSAHGLQDRAMLSEAYEQARACDPTHSQLVHLEKFLEDEA